MTKKKPLLLPENEDIVRQFFAHILDMADELDEDLEGTIIADDFRNFVYDESKKLNITL